MTTKNKATKTAPKQDKSETKVHLMTDLFNNDALTIPELLDIILNDDIKIGNVVTSGKRLDVSNTYGVKAGKDEEEQTLKNLVIKTLGQYKVEVDMKTTTEQLEKLESMIDEEIELFMKDKNDEEGVTMPSLSANREGKLGQLIRTYTRKSGQVGRSMSMLTKYLKSIGYSTQTQAKATYRYLLEDTADKLLKNIDALEVTDQAIIIQGKELAFSFFSCPPLIGGMASGSNSGLISEVDNLFND